MVLFISPEQVDRSTGVLFDLGCCGLQDATEEDPARLIAFFPEETGRQAVLKAIQDELGRIELHSKPVYREDWTTAWRTHFDPVRVTDRILVCAPWHDDAPPSKGFRVSIDPKTAFGTGGHPTTCLALRGLEAVVRAGDSVLDVGTGSGILAIAARMMGASRVTAIDTDPLAGENAAENIALNGVENIRVETREMQRSDRGYDVIVANILSSILIPMMTRIHEGLRPGGCAVFGGLLGRERVNFSAGLERTGFECLEIQEGEGWIGFVTKRC